MIDIRQPNITAQTETEQLRQLRSYVYQLSQQLQWAFNTLEPGGATYESIAQQAAASAPKQSPAENFSSIKALIIKSADIVEAYYQTISRKLEGVYVAQSDFGDFAEHTTQTIEESSTAITQLFSSTQVIANTVEQIYDAQIGVNAYVKTGKLYEDGQGVPVYGLEIGQTNEVQGQEIFSRFARFTSDRLSFYDRNDTEIAYISDYKLYITNAEITGSITIGGRFKIYADRGLSFQWIGGNNG